MVMGEFKKPLTRADYQENFSQIKPLMNATMAYYESSRCLFCYDAPCVTACPTGIDIPLFIRQINNGNLSGAAKTIYNRNYFGNTCGKVCPTEVLCEGACVYNEQQVKAIEIGRLQNFATQHAIENNMSMRGASEENGKRVAIIGAGPAGISCACELSSLGYSVDIFEAKSEAGGLALYGTAPYKILNEEVISEVEYLKNQFGFTIYYDHSIIDPASINKLEAEYDAIFLGIGLGGTRDMSIRGEKLNNCLGATEFIESLKMDPLSTFVGKKVVVIGGGNTAMDAASESSRMGAEEVTLIYRREKERMRAYEFELDLAKSVGVKSLFEVRPLKILGEGTVSGVKCIRTCSQDSSLQDIQGSEFDIECDMVIKATGQEKMIDLLVLLNIKYDHSGRIKTNPDSYQCSNPKYFTGGDALNGGAEVVNACAEAKGAAQEIDLFLRDK
jgi:glutamate synthase (NADPH/NADH) small chain